MKWKNPGTRILLFLQVFLVHLADAQESAFLSSFSGSNVNPQVYADPSWTDADWVVGSTKSHGLGIIDENGFSLDMGNTSAAWVEAAARLINIPVSLTEPGDVIRVVLGFTAESGILLGAVSQLGIGLYYSGESSPPSAVTDQIRFDFSDYTSDYMQGWVGYALLFETDGGVNRLYARPAQPVGTINSAQELLFPKNTGSFANPVTLPSGSEPGASLVNGTACTLVYTLTLNSSTSLTLQGELYQGPDGTGILLATASGTATGGNLLTTQFDAMGLGYIRKNVTGSSSILYTSLEILTNKPTTPARVVSGPEDLTLITGGDGELSVIVTGAQPVTYEWYKDDGLLVGANTGSISFTDADPSIEGTYYVVVTNEYGTDTSPDAAVSVTSEIIAPSITEQPAGATRLTGGSMTFSVVASGTSPFHYDWKKDGQSLSVPDENKLTVADLTLEDAGTYTVVVSNSGGSEESQPALLEVWSEPTILSDPVSVMAEPGNEVTLSVAADGFPAPTFKWYRDGGLLINETGSSLAIPSVSLSDVGQYTVDVINAAGVVRSAPAAVNVISNLALVGSFPLFPPSNLPVDIQIPLAFDRPVQPGITGRIQLFEFPGTLVDTIDMAGGSQTRTVGGLVYNYDPVLTDGANAWLVFHAGAMQYGKTYYVTIEAGAIRDEDGGSYGGVSDTGSIRFSTRSTAPAADVQLLRVSGSGTGDFSTIQGAIDHVPPGNNKPVTVRVEPGTYRELLHIPSNKPYITLQGSSKDEVIVSYRNNANRNPSNQRASFYSKANDLTIDSMTFVNTTPKGGSQAETLNSSGNRIVVRDSAFVSLQDTLKLSDGGVYLYSCYIEGDVDFMWDDAGAYFDECIIHSVNKGYLVQVRNGQNGRGFVFVRCRLTSEPDAAGTYLGRIDPTVFPYSEAAFIDCAMGPHIALSGWLLNNAGTAPHVRFLEYGSTDLEGDPLDLSGRLADATLLDPATADQYRDPAWVTGFNPAKTAWMGALRDRIPANWSIDSTLGWTWGHDRTVSGQDLFLWVHTFGNWLLVIPDSADTAFLYSYSGEESGWFWCDRRLGAWAWSYSKERWTELGG